MSSLKVKLIALTVMITVLLSSAVICFAGYGSCRGSYGPCPDGCAYFKGSGAYCDYCGHGYTLHRQ